MKSKSKYILILLIVLFSFGKSYSDEIKFEAKEINITNEGNFIDASGDAEIILNSFTKINSNNFTYDKLKSILEDIWARNLAQGSFNRTGFESCHYLCGGTIIIDDVIIYDVIIQNVTLDDKN